MGYENPQITTKKKPVTGKQLDALLHGLCGSYNLVDYKLIYWRRECHARNKHDTGPENLEPSLALTYKQSGTQM